MDIQQPGAVKKNAPTASFFVAVGAIFFNAPLFNNKTIAESNAAAKILKAISQKRHDGFLSLPLHFGCQARIEPYVWPTLHFEVLRNGMQNHCTHTSPLRHVSAPGSGNFSYWESCWYCDNKVVRSVLVHVVFVFSFFFFFFCKAQFLPIMDLICTTLTWVAAVVPQQSKEQGPCWPTRPRRSWRKPKGYC